MAHGHFKVRPLSVLVVDTCRSLDLYFFGCFVRAAEIKIIRSKAPVCRLACLVISIVFVQLLSESAVQLLILAFFTVVGILCVRRAETSLRSLLSSARALDAAGRCPHTCAQAHGCAHVLTPCSAGHAVGHDKRPNSPDDENQARTRRNMACFPDVCPCKLEGAFGN
jgi:hypothetical protein